MRSHILPFLAPRSAIGSPRCFSLAGQTTLRKLYGLVDVLVTNDSGPRSFCLADNDPYGGAFRP